jgi:hypothetical protein
MKTIKILKILFWFVLFFNILNTVVAIPLQYFGPMLLDFIEMDSSPFVYQKRSFLSFILLSFLSYYCLIKFYYTLKLNYKFKAIFILFMSLWFQYLSVQFVGIVACPYIIKPSSLYQEPRRYMIVEYYSIFGFQRSNCIEIDNCNGRIQHFNDEKMILECKTDLEISLLEKIIFKKYRTSRYESIYVLDGIGPFFTLSISENTFEH